MWGHNWGHKIMLIRRCPQMPLTDIVCKTAKPSEKPRKIADEKGLYLEVMPNGGKYFRMKYRFGGKEKRIAFGVYPEISLKEAREKCLEARKLIREGGDPVQVRKEEKHHQQAASENSFEKIARTWHTDQKPSWTLNHANYVIKRLESDVFPVLGHKSITDIKPIELLSAVKEVEKRGALDIAKRLLQTCGQIYRYAIIHEKTEYDITAGLKDGLSKPGKKKHHASLTEKDLPEFLERLDTYDGEFQTKLALELLLLTFVRTTELRGIKWQEIDYAKKEIKIPAERMKMKEDHIVPLSGQALRVIEQLKALTGHKEYVFPSRTNPKSYMSNNTMLYAMYRMGYHSRATPHGFRATASTILHEQGFPSDIIELQLSHAERNKVKASYNFAKRLSERHEMMQWWADFLDRARGHKGNVIEGKFGSVR